MSADVPPRLHSGPLKSALMVNTETRVKAVPRGWCSKEAGLTSEHLPLCSGLALLGPDGPDSHPHDRPQGLMQSLHPGRAFLAFRSHLKRTGAEPCVIQRRGPCYPDLPRSSESGGRYRHRAGYRGRQPRGAEVQAVVCRSGGQEGIPGKGNSTCKKAWRQETGAHPRELQEV